jgi:hypothetical protein
VEKLNVALMEGFAEAAHSSAADMSSVEDIRLVEGRLGGSLVEGSMPIAVVTNLESCDILSVRRGDAALVSCAKDNARTCDTNWVMGHRSRRDAVDSHVVEMIQIAYQLAGVYRVAARKGVAGEDTSRDLWTRGVTPSGARLTVIAYV